MSNVQPVVVTPASHNRFYIDVTTRNINTNTGVSGSNNNFETIIQDLILDYANIYTVEVESFFYRNAVVAPDVYPIILSDIGDNIRVVNTNSSILYRSTVPANNTNEQQRDKTNNARFVLPLQNKSIRSIAFQIVRSDNGQLFPLDVGSSVQITLLIKQH
jgi:hypothetical protein